MASILVIHGHQEVCHLLCPAVERMGHSCFATSSCEEAAKLLQAEACDIVIMDIESSSPETEILSHILETTCRPDIIAISNGQSPAELGRIVKVGIWDILHAPFTMEDLARLINRCIFHRQAVQRNQSSAPIKRNGIIGTTPKLERCLAKIVTTANNNANVLLLGETGTGKELFAKAIHDNSPRASQNFIVVDCTNLPSSLAESLLFGHERGSFTGASEARDGLFKQAHGGTIFLDEIGDLDLEVQKSLLRVLQNRKFRPLSSKKEVESDFRIIAATNRNLEEMVQEGTFRKDLYHRLHTRTIHLPPLRERREDIKLIARHYVREICQELKCPAKELSNELGQSLLEYDWPGNIRELINVVHATIHNAFAENRLYPQHLPMNIRAAIICHKVGGNGSGEYFICSDPDASDPITTSTQPAHEPEPEEFTDQAPLPIQPAKLCEQQRPDDAIRISLKLRPDLPTLRMARDQCIEEVENAYLRTLIDVCAGNFQDALVKSGLSRARLYDLLSKYNLSFRN